MRAFMGLGAAIVAACSGVGPGGPIPTVAEVDLQRFAGTWFVLASIPTFVERDAYNAVERYSAPVDDRIATEFTFNVGGFDGPQKTLRPTGFVSADSDAVWGMQFLWPFKAEYRIVYLDPDYQYTIIGRSKRDYVWIMARAPELSAARYEALVAIVAQLGYDPSQLRRVPHQIAPGVVQTRD